MFPLYTPGNSDSILRSSASDQICLRLTTAEKVFVVRSSEAVNRKELEVELDQSRFLSFST